MKAVIKTIAAMAGVVLVTVQTYAAQVTSCYTVTDFNNECTSGSCCPDGNYMLEYSCPSGWTLSGTTCVRNGSTTGSDSTGTYTLTYGSCDASSTRQKCCTKKAGTDKTCLQCASSQL